MVLKCGFFLFMHDLYSENNIRKSKLIMDRFFGELIESTESVDLKTEQGEVRNKSFFWNESKIETMPEIEERLNELGIENVDLRGTKEIWQKKIAASVESMFESHPELQGCLGCIRTAKLDDGVYACTGPRMTENGISSEIQLNEKMFSKSDLELKIVDMQIENFRGETWFAGKGLDGVLKHEMAHIMHLKMIADKEEISFGDTDKEKYELLSQGYYRNSVVAKLCNDSLKELDISPKDVARELSVYGASDFGEFFAEAISESETSKKPRPLAMRVNEKYNEYLNNKEVKL
jgi:hypothetical protein